MASSTIQLGGCAGIVFEGVDPDAFCFVPLSCLRRQNDGSWLIDESAYVRSSWHERNAAFNFLTNGSSLFPRADAPADDRPDSPAKAYVERLQRSYLGRAVTATPFPGARAG